MAHFAELDENNVVLRVIVVSDDNVKNSEGIEVEAKGADFCKRLLGGNWKQTSYNGKIRKNYAGIGYTYDPELDAFIPPKIFESWVLDRDTCTWVAPTPMPDGDCYWDEESRSWISTGNIS